MRSKGVSNKAMAEHVGVSAGAVSNWFKTGRISKENLVRAAERLGTSAHSLIAGDDLPQAEEAHALSLHPVTLPILIEDWRGFMSLKDVPTSFRVPLPDDALAPRYPAGTVVIFYAADQAQPGDAVIVEDAEGRRHVRVYREGRPGTWEAFALNPAYRTLQSEVDGLKVLAVWGGVMSRFSAV